MLFTSHVLTGAAIGTLARRPLPAALLGVTSHVAMDSLPHWGDIPIHEVLHIARADGLTALALGGAAVVAARGRRIPVAAGAFGAGMLDLDKPFRHFFGFSPFPAAVDRFHSAIQREQDHRLPYEVATAAALAASLALLLART